MARWDDATAGVPRVHAEAQAQQAAREAEETRKRREAAERAAREESERQERQRQIDQAGRELETFLASADGASALRFLAAADKQVSFGTENQGGGYYTNVFLSGLGLRTATEKGGMGFAMSASAAEKAAEAKRAKANEQPISGSHTVSHWMRNLASEGNEPADLLRWLTDQIDELAKQYRS